MYHLGFKFERPTPSSLQDENHRFAFSDIHSSSALVSIDHSLLPHSEGNFLMRSDLQQVILALGKYSCNRLMTDEVGYCAFGTGSPKMKGPPTTHGRDTSLSHKVTVSDDTRILSKVDTTDIYECLLLVDRKKML